MVLTKSELIASLQNEVRILFTWRARSIARRSTTALRRNSAARSSC